MIEKLIELLEEVFFRLDRKLGEEEKEEKEQEISCLGSEERKRTRRYFRNLSQVVVGTQKATEYNHYNLVRKDGLGQENG